MYIGLVWNFHRHGFDRKRQCTSRYNFTAWIRTPRRMTVETLSHNWDFLKVPSHNSNLMNLAALSCTTRRITHFFQKSRRTICFFTRPRRMPQFPLSEWTTGKQTAWMIHYADNVSLFRLFQTFLRPNCKKLFKLSEILTEQRSKIFNSADRYKDYQSDIIQEKNVMSENRDSVCSEDCRNTRRNPHPKNSPQFCYNSSISLSCLLSASCNGSSLQR